LAQELLVRKWQEAIPFIRALVAQMKVSPALVKMMCMATVLEDSVNHLLSLHPPANPTTSTPPLAVVIQMALLPLLHLLLPLEEAGEEGKHIYLPVMSMMILLLFPVGWGALIICALGTLLP
jgi:hypothetical protein